MKVEIMRGTGKENSQKWVEVPPGIKIQPGLLIEEIFQGFIEGVRANGDEPVINTSPRFSPEFPTAPVAFIMGYGRRNDGTVKHGMQGFRYEILKHQQERGGRTICFDGGFFKGIGNYEYYRVGLDSPLGNGTFLNKNSPSDRWLEFKEKYNITYNPWKKEGDFILVCTQPDNGYSMNLKSTVQLVLEWIPQIRKLTDKKIVIKPHPNNMNQTREISQLTEFIKNEKSANRNDIEMVDARSSLGDYLPGAQAMVTWNSTVAVETVAYGIPTFSFDNLCMAWNVTDHDLNKLPNPTLFDREQWIADLHYASWNAKELATGELWAKFKEHIQTT